MDASVFFISVSITTEGYFAICPSKGVRTQTFSLSVYLVLIFVPCFLSCFPLCFVFKVGLSPNALNLFDSYSLVFLCLSAPSQKKGFKSFLRF